MAKSLARDGVHSTILTSLQKPRVPDCRPSGSVTLNFWTVLTAFSLLHIHGGGGKETHLRSDHRLKTEGLRVNSALIHMCAVCSLEHPKCRQGAVFPSHLHLRLIPEIFSNLMTYHGTKSSTGARPCQWSKLTDVKSPRRLFRPLLKMDRPVLL